MASIPFFLELDVTIAAAGGLATVSYAIPTQQKLTINDLTWSATGVWGFYSIHNSNGKIYTNASQATPLRSTSFQNGGSPNIGDLHFPYPFLINGADIIYFDIINTSAGANTIQLCFFGAIDNGVG